MNPTPDAPKPVSVKEAVMAASPDRVQANLLNTPEQTAAYKRAQEIDDQRKRGLNPEQQLRDIRARKSESSYRATEGKVIGRRFGAGLGKEDPSGSVDLLFEASLPSEVKDSYKDGQKLAQKVDRTALYADAITEARQKGIDVNNSALMQQLLADRESKDSWSAVETSAKDMLKVALKDVDPSGQLVDLVDVGALDVTDILVDDTFRTKLLQSLRAVREEATQLKDVVEDPKITEVKANKQKAEEDRQKAADRVKQAFVNAGFALDPTMQGRVDLLVLSGKSPDIALDELRKDLLYDKTKFPRLDEIKELKVAQEVVEIAKKDYDHVAKGGGKNNEPPELYTVELNKAKTELDVLKQKFKAYADFDTQFKQYEATEKLLGQDSGLAARSLDEAIKANAEVLKADKELVVKGGAAERTFRNAIEERLLKESEVMDKLSGAVREAAIDALEQKLVKAQQLDKDRMERVAEEAEKTGKESLAKSIRDVGLAQDKNWVAYDQNSRKQSVNREAIGSDMRFAAYHGEDGIKRLVLRDAKIVVKDASGQPVTYDWRTVDLKSLPEETQKLIEETYSACGEAYRNRLFGDYFIARDKGLGGISAEFGALRLKDHEWALLEKNFTGALEQQLSSSKDGKAALAALEAKGITPGVKRKWLVYLMIILGLGAGALLGPAGLAIAGVGGLAAVGKQDFESH